ncbi:ABC transporter substrate-binding protein [Mycobacterium sp. ITM-2016-00317]|uniref:ABC transporter substrate-binding protein n=1 Tax=Mycobacterium sp. ITM-2016-00317 TaxID=2099694 RepID=UPI000D431D3E|nr:ABC transporter substrate-binding protein [Mycobacterium sp. ITM-2016-00317]WNG86576.1 ABC transporter substrate-binding protein [Mycobacterium sp. ITM-2016-00317]
MKKSTKVWSSAAAAAALLAVPACSGGSGGDAGGSGDPLVVGMLMAFSGPTAVEGAEVVNGCLPAAAEINEAGGVLGRDIECEAFDTKGTASDSVPAARQMLSTTGNLFTVLGPSTAEAAAAAPVLEEATQVMFSPAGDGRFDRTELDYYYRLITSDTVGAQAMALHSQQQGFDKVALVFVGGASAQANIPPLEEALGGLGVDVTEAMTIQPEQPSYRTEVARILQNRPAAIVFEADAVTAGTFLTELNQAGGADIPIVTNTLATTGDWQKVAVNAYGGDEALAKSLQVVVRYAQEGGAGTETYVETLQSLEGQDGIDVPSFKDSAYSRAAYDGVILSGLAATKTDSVEPEDYNSVIPELLAAGDAKTVVTNYSEGVEALGKGEDIQYVGANGEYRLNEFHNVIGAFAFYDWDPAAKQLRLVNQLPADELEALASGQR